MTQSQLNEIKRLEAAQSNAIEHFPLFLTAMTMATLGGVDANVVNGCAAIYTVGRVGYTIAYVKITTETASYARSVLWWVGNLSCFYLLWSVRSKINVI
jgi:uncharacterized MAPEG superfamily protein